MYEKLYKTKCTAGGWSIMLYFGPMIIFYTYFLVLNSWCVQKSHLLKYTCFTLRLNIEKPHNLYFFALHLLLKDNFYIKIFQNSYFQGST